jgi:hypothetical protein
MQNKQCFCLIQQTQSAENTVRCGLAIQSSKVCFVETDASKYSFYLKNAFLRKTGKSKPDCFGELLCAIFAPEDCEFEDSGRSPRVSETRGDRHKSSFGPELKRLRVSKRRNGGRIRSETGAALARALGLRRWAARPRARRDAPFPRTENAVRAPRERRCSYGFLDASRGRPPRLPLFVFRIKILH